LGKVLGLGPAYTNMGRILVADDNPEVRDAIGRLLEAEGHTVLYAEDGPSTLSEVRTQKPDILLLDLEMPEMGGLEVLQLIREDPSVMTTSVIIVSVRGRASDRDRAEELDVTDYILKPWQDGEIEMRVKFAMGSLDKTRIIIDPDGERTPDPTPAASSDPDLSIFLEDDDPDEDDDGSSTNVEPEAPRPEAAIEGESSSGRGVFVPSKKDTGNEKKIISFAPTGRFKVPDIIPIAIIPPPDDPDSALILVVEDEEYARLPLVDCMQRAGFRTIEASDGAKVEKIVMEHKPDVVLLDLTLPRMNGIQVLRTIKGNGEIRKTSVIMVTGNTDRDIIENCMSIGARDFVPKPWHAGDIQHRVKRAVKSARALSAQIERAHDRAVGRSKRRKARRSA